MANEKKLTTRIILKNDELATLNSSTFIPKKGEAIYAKFTTLKTDPITNEKVPVPTYMHKIGDGTHKFSELNWTAALAADVYDWAKKASLDVNDIPTLSMEKIDGLSEALNGKSDSDHKHDDVYKKLQTAVSEVGAADKTLTISQNQNGEITATPVDIQISEAQVTGLTTALAGKSDTTHNHKASTLTDFTADVTKVVNDLGITTEGVADLGNRLGAVEGDIENIKNDSTGVIDSFADVVAELAKKQDTIPANTYDAYGEASKALQDAKDYTDQVKAGILGEGITETFDTLKEIEDWIDKQGGETVELTKAIAAETKSREDGDKAINDIIDTYGDIVTHNVSEFQKAGNYEEAGASATALQEAKKYTDDEIAELDLANTYAPLSHNHTVSEITDYADDVAAKIKVETDARSEAVEDLQGQIDNVKSTADTALQSIVTTTNGGLKVTGTNQIDIDTDVVFVFDCGSATVNID